MTTLAEEYKQLVLLRTGLKPNELVCPREKSDMTPCVARDGELAACGTGHAPPTHCVGCDEPIQRLLDKERAKHRPTEGKPIGEGKCDHCGRDIGTGHDSRCPYSPGPDN